VLLALTVSAVATTVSFALAGAETDAHPLETGDWDLVFIDRFDGTALEDGVWNTCHWWDDGGCTIAGNEELQWYVPAGVSVSGGSLLLTAAEADIVGADGTSFAYTSGMVSSGPGDYEGDDPAGFTFTYGYAEMEARVPAGTGLWPAFWLLPADRESRPEIDVMEILGHDPGTLAVHFHHDDGGERVSVGESIDTADLAGGMHRYGLLWEERRLVWYLDGDAVWSYDGIGIPDEPMYLVANLAVGGEYPGDPDESTEFPAVFEIDRIRVWQEQP
jgi:beta-glucanase (GH16 family)